MPFTGFSQARYKTLLWLFVSHLLYWAILGFLCSGLGVGEALRFYAINITYVLIPGLALASLMGGKPSLGRGITLLFLSYLFGFGWLIFCLVGSLSLNLPLLFYASPLLGAILLLPGLRQRLPLALSHRELLAASFALIVFSGVLFPLKVYLSPMSALGQTMHINGDLLWEIGTSLSLSRVFPPQDFQMVGFPLSYHYFVHAFLAALYKLLPGTSMETVYLRLFPFLFAALASIGVVSLALRSKIRGYRLALLIVLVALWSAGETSLVDRFNITVSTFVFSCLFLIGIFHLIIQKKIGWASSVALGLLAFLGAGCKISLIPVLAAGLACELSFSLLITRRLCWASLAQLIIIVGAGLLAWLMVFRSEGRLALGLTFEPLSIAAQTLTQTNLLGKVSHYSWYFLTTFWPLIFLALLPFVRCPLSSSRGRRWWRLGAFSLAAGLTASLLFAHVTSSQSHFQVYALYCIPMLLLTWLKGPPRAVKLMLGLLTVCSIGSGLYSRVREFEAQKVRLAEHLNPSANYPYYLDRITKGSIEVMAYIRKFSRRDSIIAHHPLQTWPGYERYYYFTAISERRSFLSGPEYTIFGNIRRWQGVDRIRELAKTEAYFAEAEQRYLDRDTLFEAKDVEEVKLVLTRQSFDILIHGKEMILPYDWTKIYDKVLENEDLVLYQVKGKHPFGAVPPDLHAIFN